MKLAEVLKIAATMLATDSSPAGIAKAEAAVIAADKKAKDGMGPAELEKNDKAKDSDKEDDVNKPAKDADKEDDEDKEKPAKDADKTEVDCNGRDTPLSSADPEPPGGKREKGKVAVDGAEVDARIAAAVQAERDANTARETVRPILGVVAFDSAEKIYRAALDKLGVDHATLPAASLATVLGIKMDAVRAVPAPIAADAATVKSMKTVIKGYDRL